MPSLGIERRISQHVALSLYGPCHPSCMCGVNEHTNPVTNRIIIDWKQAMQNEGHSFSPLFFLLKACGYYSLIRGRCNCCLPSVEIIRKCACCLPAIQQTSHLSDTTELINSNCPPTLCQQLFVLMKNRSVTFKNGLFHPQLLELINYTLSRGGEFNSIP